jgi:hypothetical protein
MPYTEGNVRADITVGSVHIGYADKWDGGDKASTIATYRRVQGEKVLCGVPARNVGKATYLVDEPLWAVFRQLDHSVGDGGQRVVVGLTPCADDGTPFAGGGITLSGILSNVPLPIADPKSATPSEVTFEIALNTALAA